MVYGAGRVQSVHVHAIDRARERQRRLLARVQNGLSTAMQIREDVMLAKLLRLRLVTASGALIVFVFLSLPTLFAS